MAPNDFAPAHLSNRELLVEVARLAASEREATTALVALLAEVDARRLHLAEGCSSLFTYCTERLHLSEHTAYHRIEAARAVRAFPVILGYLLDGSVTLTSVTLLRPHLAAENHERLLAAARHRSKREVEVLVRSIAPLPDVRASLRRLPTVTRALAKGPSDAAMSAADASKVADILAATTSLSSNSASCAPCATPRPAAVSVLSPERYSLRVTLSVEGHARLRRAQELLRHRVPDGDPAVIVERALVLLVEQLERTKFSAKQATAAPVAVHDAAPPTGRARRPLRRLGDVPPANDRRARSRRT